MVERNEQLTQREIDVLNWINRFRQCFGVEPLSRIENGMRFSPSRCPVVQSLQKGIDDYSFISDSIAIDIYRRNRVWFESDYSNQFHLPVPDYVRDFILLFDTGYYPQYFLKGSQWGWA